jgi:hypothetical protein
LRVSSTTASSKKAAWFAKRNAEKSQNLAGARRCSARPASWARVEEGCQGWICWRKMSWRLEARAGVARMWGMVVAVRVLKISVFVFLLDGLGG